MENVIDAKGKAIVVGARIAPYKDENVDIPGGVVTEITDLDGDINDEGMPYAIYPRVVVLFDDGETDSFTTYWTAKGWWDEDAPYECEDLEIEAA